MGKRVREGAATIPTVADSDDQDPAERMDRPRAVSLSARINRADGGREVHAGTEGSHVHQPDWSRGEFFDGGDAKDGAIDPSRGEAYFRPDNDSIRAVSDRTYRGGRWKPAAEVGAGKVVDVPYRTR